MFKKITFIPFAQIAVLRNRQYRKNGLSARNQPKIHENDQVLLEICTLFHYYAKVITLSAGKCSLLHYQAKQIILHYHAARLLHYQMMLLHYQTYACSSTRRG